MKSPSWLSRRGLGRLGQRLGDLDEVRIGWLGGSITQWPAEPTGYRVATTTWLTQRARGRVIGINAARSATGSVLGCFRFDADLAAHRPHVVFVEFCVNDGLTQPDHIMNAMRAIVVKSAAIDADVCFVYTIGKGQVQAIAEGRLPGALTLHESVAQEFDVPAVFVGPALATDVNAGRLAWADVMADQVHPLPLGHAHYAATLTTALDQLLVAKPHGPLEPRPAAWAGARFSHLEAAAEEAGWSWVADDPNFIPGIEAVAVPNESARPLRVAFEGTVVGIDAVVDPPVAATVEWAVDGGPWNRADLNGGAKRRWSVFAELSAGDHVVEIRPPAAAAIAHVLVA